MSKSGNAPRKPATKFPHLRKQMQKNLVASKMPLKPRGPASGRKGAK
jgi:hypothetical protein